MPVGTEAARAGSARWRSTSCASSGLRQARAGYRLRRCPVRLPLMGLPAGMGRPAGGSMGRAASPMGWSARTAGCSTADCRRWDVAAGICSHRPSRSPARTRQGGLLSFWSQTDAVVVRRAASGRWARRRRAHDDGRDRLREGAVYPMGILITYVRGDSSCPRDQNLRLAQVADNLLRGITLSGHDDPFLVIQFLTTELDTIQGGRS